MKRKITRTVFPILDHLYRSIDKSRIRRAKNLRLIPDFKNRKGGKFSYAEWAYVIGIFQTIIFQNLKRNFGNKILDIGCGTGLLGISSEPFIYDGGTYTGIDVIEYDINFCKNHFKQSNYNFIHFDVLNPTYARKQSNERKPWPLQNNSYDLITALSVWTHLNEKDSIFYFKEINRVLKEGGKAIITFFYLDDCYSNSLNFRSNAISRFHSTNQNKWLFTESAYGSKNWFSPKWVKNAEDAIGINKEGLNILIKESNLKLINYYSGNWKEKPGVYFQDILIFEK